jgi:AcrR family transcriptional regulator
MNRPDPLPADDEPRRWKRRKVARPAEILDAALDIFAERGFAAARVEDIAARAGVSKGTVYLYFDTKEEMFRALVRENIIANIANVEVAFASYKGSARALIELAMARLVDIVSNTRLIALPKLIIAESGNFPSLAEFYRREVIDRAMELLSRVVALGKTQGEFRDLPVAHVVRLIIAPILLSAIWRASFARFDAEPFDYAAFIKTHTDVLFAGLAPHPGD